MQKRRRPLEARNFSGYLYTLRCVREDDAKQSPRNSAPPQAAVTTEARVCIGAISRRAPREIRNYVRGETLVRRSPQREVPFVIIEGVGVIDCSIRIALIKQSSHVFTGVSRVYSANKRGNHRQTFRTKTRGSLRRSQLSNAIASALRPLGRVKIA